MPSPRELRPLAPAGERLNVRGLPKVSLHDHLEGALREETVLDIGRQLGLTFPADDTQSLAGWFTDVSNSGSLVSYLESFWITDMVMQTQDSLARVACDYVLDLAFDGVVYGEVRWAPEAKTTQGMTTDQAVEAVQAGIEDGQKQAAADGKTIVVRQILSAMRNGPHASDIAQLALRHRGRGVVGFDIAGPEAGFPPSAHRAAFDILARQLFPVTVHAGEAEGTDSIRSALVDGRALRLGHGVRIMEDITMRAGVAELGNIARWVRDRRIVLETSPSSNLHTGAVARWATTIEEHPFALLDKFGFVVTINTDNRLMSQTTLSHDTALLCEAFGYGLDDLERFQLNALTAAFIDHDERVAIEQQVRAGFEAARAPAN